MIRLYAYVDNDDRFSAEDGILELGKHTDLARAYQVARLITMGGHDMQLYATDGEDTWSFERMGEVNAWRHEWKNKDVR
jgi:hypothetical protein